MNIGDLKIGVRLGAGFGAVLILTLMLIALASSGLSRVGDISDSMANQDWPKADATLKINTLMRSNARRTLELLVLDDTSARAQTFSKISENKKNIDDLIQKLDGMIYRPEGKSMLAQFKQARGQYVASFTQVGSLVKEGKLDDAKRLATIETLPRLDAATRVIDDLTAFQGAQVTQSGQQSIQTIASVRMQMFIVGGAAVLIGAALALWITRSITRPINAAVQVAVTVAKGDLTQRIDVKSRDETGQLLGALREMSDSLRKLVGDVRRGSDMIATATGEIAAGNTDLSARTEEQAASLEETASSMEELTATVRQNAESARQGNMLAANASQVATRSGEVVGRVVQTMRDISSSSSKVAEIIGTIVPRSNFVSSSPKESPALR